MKEWKYSNEEIANLCTELTYLLRTGIGTADALNMLAEDETRRAYKENLEKLAARADEGLELSELFGTCGSFPAYVGRMIAVGERTGRTLEALEALAASCDRKAELEKRIRSALLYPSILLLIMLAVVAVLLIYVLPVFNTVYAQLGGSLTGVAGGLLAFGQTLGKFMPALITVFILAVAFLAAFSAIPAFRGAVIDSWQKTRGDKGLAGQTATASFARALALAMSSGMEIDEAVEAAAELAADTPNTKEKLVRCVEALRGGESTAAALRDSGMLPPAQCRILEAGIRGGSGEVAMDRIAQKLTEDSEAAMEEAMASIEPTMVIITSLLVGLILLSVMLPLINIMSVIG